MSQSPPSSSSSGPSGSPPITTTTTSNPTTAAPSWRALLTPWASLLRGRVRLVTTTFSSHAPPADGAWVRLFMPPEDERSADFWVFIAEALELLDLYARLDCRACWQLLGDASHYASPFPLDSQAFLLGDARPQYRLKFGAGELAADGFLCVGAVFAKGVSESAHTPEFHETRTPLLAAWRALHGDGVNDEIDWRSRDERITVRAEFEIYGDMDDALATAFLHMDHLAHMQNDAAYRPDKKSSSTATRRLFEFDAFSFDMFDWPVRRAMYRALTNVVQYMPFGNYDLNAFVWGTDKYARAACAFWSEALVPWRGRRRCERRGIQRLSISLGDQYDVRAIQAVGSGMVQSKSLRQVSMSDLSYIGDPAPSAVVTEWWRWFAYAMFSVDADHNVDTVELHCGKLLTHHVEAMERVLQHPNPAALLMQDVTGLSDDELRAMAPRIVSLYTDSLLHIGTKQDYVEGVTLNVPVRHDDLWFRVVGDSPANDFVYVLLPGAGLAWVERTAVYCTRAPPRRAKRDQTIRRVKLHVGSAADDHVDDDDDGTIVLMELIGHAVTTLQVESHEYFTDEYLLELITACPHLTRLELLKIHADNWEWLLDLPRVVPKLEALVMERPRSQDDNIEDLLRHLGDVTHALHRHLRELVVTWPSSDSSFSPELLETALAAISQSRFLHRVVFVADDLELINEYTPRFRELDNAPLALEQSPLPLPCKLALLSVCSPPSGYRITTKKPRLDFTSVGRILPQEALAQIFSFAAIPHRRFCALLCSRRRYVNRKYAWLSNPTLTTVGGTRHRLGMCR